MLGQIRLQISDRVLQLIQDTYIHVISPKTHELDKVDPQYRDRTLLLIARLSFG